MDDHTKLGDIILNMAQKTGQIPTAEDCKQLHNALDVLKADMENEDKEALIYCNDGHTHRAGDVNVWGTCPDMAY